ncbi:phosphatidate phosphatase PAH2-like isoform X2 [Asparagus officinalis]|uniref:phosphatidate phosphatase PAH2-like isoform X2 n=1 Tax=Asparagus officinalis TaxID=4686 RepID=UPI00098E11D6|nr:phosphatidate phosphatase PAH2-like isoform X2 [Asparagus officinalis]
MYAVEKLSSYITRGVYTVSGPFHPFGGAVDIIVVQQQDGSFKSSPWYVRFGKFQGVLRTTEKVVTICVNGVEAGFHMYLDPRGEAYFLKDSDSTEEGEDFEISPSTSGDEVDEKVRSVREKTVTLENGNGKVVSRTNSRRARIFGLMFGNKSMKGNDSGANVDRVSSLESAEIAANLLDTKWSTNLQSNDFRTDDRRDFDACIVENEMASSHNGHTDDSSPTTTLSREHFEEVVISNSPVVASNNLVDDPNPPSTIEDSAKGSVGSINENLSDNHRPKMVREVHFVTQTSTSRTHEEVVEIYTMEPGDLGDSSKLVSELVMVESDEYNISSNRSVHDNFTNEAQIPHSRADDQTVSAPEEICREQNEVRSFSYMEALESSTAIFDFSTQTNNTLDLSSGGGGPVQKYPEITSNTSEHICEEPSKPKSDKATDRESNGGSPSQDLELSNVEVSSVCQDSQDTERNGSNVEFPQKSCSSETVINYEEREAIKLPFSSDEHEESCYQNRLNISQEESRFSLSQSLNNEQFQFSDIDSFAIQQVNPEVQVSNSSSETDESALLKSQGDRDEHELNDANLKDCFESVSGSQSSPVAIPRSTLQSGETELSTNSLPIIRSKIHDLETSNVLRTLSCSLDSSPRSYEQDLLKNEMSSFAKLSDSGRDVKQDIHEFQAAVADVDSENKQDRNASPINPTVELSLCKDLLFYGMGADAASRVFDANKVNLEKFSTLGPSLVKNDKLIVRIGGRYFPWDAAAPIILGTICFGQEQIFEPQGMIAVDKDERKSSHDSSGAIVPSGGSWRLWPFSLKKSKTISTVRSIPESKIQENVNVTPLRSRSSIGHDDTERDKRTKKKVRSLTPSSEDLASLNLREGRNVITFSFSTAMLGQQQVDARIYLWKWNTRIVISDVDGTITKSDVLGQFMPLVGKDWSQTGVAHLFSAIKVEEILLKV